MLREGARVVDPVHEARRRRERDDAVGADAVLAAEGAVRVAVAAVAEELVAQAEDLLDDAVLAQIVVDLDELAVGAAVVGDDGDLLRRVVAADEAVCWEEVADGRKKLEAVRVVDGGGVERRRRR